MIASFVIGGHCYDGSRRAGWLGNFEFPDFSCGLQTVHDRHMVIHQDNIKGGFFESFKSLEPVLGRSNIVTLSF